MNTTLYTDEELIAMSKEAEAVGDLLNAIDKLLEKETINKPKTSKNVIHVDFKIKTEFTTSMTKHSRLSLLQILKLYHDWAERTYFLVLKNNGRLRKGPVREHIVEARDIVATIMKILPMST